jgi:hypothetical protein
MDLTVAEVRGFACGGTEKTGKPESFRSVRPSVAASPFRAKAEMTAPAEVLLAPAISLTAARIESSISRVVRIEESSHLML